MELVSNVYIYDFPQVTVFVIINAETIGNFFV